MDLLNTDPVSIKKESGPQEEGGGEIPYTDIDVDLTDVKKECLQYAESTQTAG